MQVSQFGELRGLWQTAIMKYNKYKRLSALNKEQFHGTGWMTWLTKDCSALE